MKVTMIVILAASSFSVQAKHWSKRSEQLRSKMEKSNVTGMNKFSASELEQRHQLRINPLSPLNYVPVIRF